MNLLQPITTIDQLNAFLNRHPYFRDRKSFPKQYWHALCYLHLKHTLHNNNLPHTIGIDPVVIRYWYRNNHLPRLLNSLRTHEQARCQHEAAHPREHHRYRIDPSTIYESVRHLKDHLHTPETLANAIRTIYQKIEFKRFLIADFKPYHESGPRWTRTITKSIKKHQEKVENLLNQRIPLEHLPYTKLRIGIHNHKLYLYHNRKHPKDWLTRLRYEHFYFDTTETKSFLINEAKRHLNTTTIGLSRLTLQLTDHKGELTHRTSHLGEYSKQRSYLTGETLQLLLDAIGRNFKEIQLFITRLGRDAQGDGRGGIHNPIFIEGLQRDLFLSRLAAIALSDGHIHHETKQFTYIEKDPDRRHYVSSLMKEIGDVHITRDERSSADRLTMPVTIGRLLEQYGVPAGDKHLSSDYRIPETIRIGSELVKCAYLSEVIPEDGYFDTYGRAKFGIKRAQVLDAGPKTEIYGFESKISKEEQEFIKQFGEKRTQQIRNDTPRKETILTFGKIREIELTEDSQISDTATKLRQTIEHNPCKLLDDEYALITSLGINMHKTPKEVHRQENGRISMIWEMYTLEKSDALRWAQIAIPSSDPKRKKVEEWLLTQNSV
ncbi:MAG: hypothetical protein ACXADB_10695 [Candidatus Hermodarchaeia archaeon]|jgi:hypothetical protein